ncbi:MAG TPA: ZIP family metal transporter [Candidatus Magasanikbacteria bacterium]|mgnify:CR=1 FL=1|nr:ZIP family metal transporter [Candidatus Magasanikbacteria bacterium]
MNVLVNSILAAFIVSIISFVGVLSLVFKDKILKRIVFYLVAISAGSLMGSAFLHLIPESLESVAGEGDWGIEKIFITVLIGFAMFFILERVLHWHHCHKNNGETCEVHPFTYLNLIGDGLHNFIDGVVIVAAFSLSPVLGFTTTIGMILHEVPQEISDFGVLIYGGLTKVKALFFNFFSGLLAVLGVLCGFVLVSFVQGIIPLLVGITAGGFIYISASDLIPELHKEAKFSKSLIAFFCFFAGLVLMFFLRMGHGH